MAEQKKRIGIVTMYYNSTNYGGLLQAYALTRYLNDHGYDAKQITYDFYNKGIDLFSPEHSKPDPAPVLFLKRIVKGRLLAFNDYRHGVGNLRRKRQKACRAFRESIPHTSEVYNDKSIDKTLALFDCFITGSDQVWNPVAYRQNFFLRFVKNADKQKVKMSYAASISNTNVTDRIKDIIRGDLSDFDIITVREKSDVDVIQPLTEKPVHWVVDPVFLLSREQWTEQCESVGEIDRLVSDVKNEKGGHYLFCYFLGDSKKHRELSEEFGKKHGLKVITIPYMQMRYRACDDGFADIRSDETTPGQFLELIRNADAIFTDSFHATAFSVIFNKQFVVFGRTEQPSMSERIKSITGLFHCEDRLCEDDKQNMSYIESVTDLENAASYDSAEFHDLLRRSKEVLKIQASFITKP